MKLITMLYKIVENPKSSQNYRELMEYFNQSGQLQIAEAIANLLKVKYGADHSNSSKQGKQP